MKNIYPVANILLLLYLSMVNLIPHAGSTLSIVFSVAGIVLVLRSENGVKITGLEKVVLGTFALYPAVYLVSFLFNNWRGDQAGFNLRHLEDEFRMLLFIPIYFLFRRIRIDENTIWTGILTGAIVSGAYASVFFFANAGDRASGSYDAIAFGAISLILGSMSVIAADALIDKHRIYRYVISTAFMLGLIACILSGSRGIWAAIPVLFVIQFVYLGKYISMGKRLTMAGVCGLLVIASYWVPATNVAQRVDSAYQETIDYLKGDVRYGGATVRLLGLRAALVVFAKHPVIGAGPGNYRPQVDRMIEQGRLHAMTARHFLPSSTILATMAVCGLSGLLALLGLFMAPLYISIKMIITHPGSRATGYALMLLVAGFFIFAMSEVIFRRSLYTNFYIIVLAALMSQADFKRTAGSKKNEDSL